MRRFDTAQKPALQSRAEGGLVMRHFQSRAFAACILLLSLVAGVKRSDGQTGPPYSINTVLAAARTMC